MPLNHKLAVELVREFLFVGVWYIQLKYKPREVNIVETTGKITWIWTENTSFTFSYLHLGESFLVFISGKPWANSWEGQSDCIFSSSPLCDIPCRIWLLFPCCHVVSSVWILETERKWCLYDWNPLYNFL